MSQTYSATETYSVADVEVVMRRVTTDLIMIAASTGAMTEKEARDYGHDIEALAKDNYLKMVDLTLMSNGIEQRAIRFEVNTAAGELTMNRPGGVLWPKLPNPELRIILFHTAAYDPLAREKMSCKLKISWVPTSADTSHINLTSSSSRYNARNT